MYVRPCESNKRLDERMTDGKKRKVHSNGKRQFTEAIVTSHSRNYNSSNQRNIHRFLQTQLTNEKAVYVRAKYLWIMVFPYAAKTCAKVL